jgi:hypothetical protein
MRSLGVALLVAVLLAAPVVPATQDRAPAAPDPITALLLDLQRAVASGSLGEMRKLTVAGVTDRDLAPFSTATRGGQTTQVIVRERARRPVENEAEVDVVIDLLVGRGMTGRVATWLVIVTPDAGAGPGAVRVRELRELAAIDGLLKLQLDATRQFTVRDLTLTGPDLRLTMASGTAFVAESPNGTTGIVLRGEGRVSFTPADAAEQLQVRLFSGRPSFDAGADTWFVRLNPAEFALRVSEKSLVPGPVNRSDLERAQEVFNDFMPRTYNVDLRHLTSDRWSIEPAAGSLIAEFRTDRHGWLTYARSPNDHEDVSFFTRSGQRNISLYASGDKRRARGASYSEDEGAAYDIEHYRLNLAFEPARNWVSGRASITVRILASSVTSLSIRLAQPLAVTSVTSPGFGDVLALRIVGQSSILVGLPTFAERGSRVTLELAYAGRLEPQPLDREAIAPQGQAQTGVDAELLKVNPEPRFMYSSRTPWYPQGPTSDYATAEMRFTVPTEYQVIASGTPMGTALAPSPDARGGQKQVRVTDFVANRPVRYLACVISRFQSLGRSRVAVEAVAPQAAGSAQVEAPDGGIDLGIVTTPRLAGRNRETSKRVADMLQFFASRVGEAPYPHFTLAAIDDNLPGGHSPAYFAAFHQPLPTTPYSWAQDPVVFEDIYPHLFLAHEVAHQWWGQAIGWKNYHEQWLSEGLAQYFSALYAAKDRGPEVLDRLIEEMRESAEPYFAQGPIALGYRLGHIKRDGRVFRALVYNKSAVVLHMLRRLIGDEAFFGGLRRFYTTWRFQKAGTAELRAAFEAGTPIRLERFFDQWIQGFGRPSLRLSWEAAVSGRGTDAPDTSRVRIEQIGEVYDLPLKLQVQYVDGRTEDLTIRLMDRTVDETVNGRIRRVTVRDALSIYEIVR